MVNFKSNKGISLYLTLIFLSVLLAISLGLSVILVSQIKIIREMAESVVAFYAADAGVEYELYTESGPGASYSGFLDLDGNGQTGTNCDQDLTTYPDDCCYQVKVLSPGDEGCQASSSCIRAIGFFRKTRRAIEVKR